MRYGLAISLFLAASLAWSAESDSDQRVEPILIGKGKSTAVVKGRLSGRAYVDHTLRAAAGQTLVVSLASSSRSLFFNVLPPGSRDAALARGEWLDNRYSGMLPDDGSYAIRVYLMRAAARRGAAADYTLDVAIEGKPLLPTATSKDALVPGTRYHANTTTTCAPGYSQVRECSAGVVRRGFDGTATVELLWGEYGIRRILFVKGEVKAADTDAAMKSTRNERGWLVEFEGGEHFEIPEPLLMGG